MTEKQMAMKKLQKKKVYWNILMWKINGSWNLK